MKGLRILKLGGSLITDKKSTVGKANRAVIEKLAAELANHKKKNKYRLVLVFGTGSFGHGPAKKYDLEKNHFDFEAVKEIRRSVMCLERILVRILKRHQLKVVGLDAMTCFLTDNGRIDKCDIESFEMFLAHDIIPVVLGNVVLDLETRFNILSSDQIATYLANRLQAEALGFGSIESGVYDENRNVIPEINPKNFDSFKKNIGGSEFNDVTSGMLGKVSEILEVRGMKALIFNAQEVKNISCFLQGKEIGTKVHSM